MVQMMQAPEVWVEAVVEDRQAGLVATKVKPTSIIYTVEY